jgi:hypothetical protein
MFRCASEPGSVQRPLDVPLTKNVLVITDSAFLGVMFGDIAFIGAYTTHTASGQRPAWVAPFDGYVDGTSLWPKDGRDVNIWQLTVGGLFGIETPLINNLLRDQFDLTEEEARRLRFEAVLVYAGGDYIHAQLFDTNRADATPATLATELHTFIKRLIQSLPGTPRGAWMGIGFYGGNSRPDQCEFPLHGPLRTMLLNSSSEDRRYMDQVTCFITAQLAKTHGQPGAITADFQTSRFSPQVPFIWMGNLATRSNSNGFGQPFAVDVVNAARLMIGAISLCLTKLCIVPSAPPRPKNFKLKGQPIGLSAPSAEPLAVAGPSNATAAVAVAGPSNAAQPGLIHVVIGFVNFRGGEPALGAVPHWGPGFTHVPGRRAVLTAFNETSRVPAHLADIHDAVVVSCTFDLLTVRFLVISSRLN